MVLPTKITIKQEKEDYEPNSSEDAYLPELPEQSSDCNRPDYEIKVKVEVDCHLSIENDWCKSGYCDDDQWLPENSVSYEMLIDYCKQDCSICNETFWESYSLLRHNLKHLELKIERLNLFENQCSTCSQYFTDVAALNKHINLTHKLNVGEDHLKVTRMLHQCQQCGKIMNYKTWHSHQKEVHGNSIYHCSICNATFKCRRYLRVHMTNTHLQTKNNRSNPNKDSVQCKLCPAVLKGKNALTTHMRNCHSKFKVQCHICKSVLKCQTYLYAHMRRVHYDDGKKYRCECGKSFKSPRYLKVHIKNAHTR